MTRKIEEIITLVQMVFMKKERRGRKRKKEKRRRRKEKGEEERYKMGSRMKMRKGGTEPEKNVDFLGTTARLINFSPRLLHV